MSQQASAAFAFVAVFVAFLALIWFAQRRLIYFPVTNLPSLDDVGLTDGEPVTFITSDGLRLGAWFLAGSGSPPRLTILVFSGNAGNRATVRRWLPRSSGTDCRCSSPIIVATAVTPGLPASLDSPPMPGQRSSIFSAGRMSMVRGLCISVSRSDPPSPSASPSSTGRRR